MRRFHGTPSPPRRPPPETSPHHAENGGHVAENSELDSVLFGPPFIVIDANNRAVATAPQLAHAQERLRVDSRAASIVGTLRAPALGVDIDPSDTAAPPAAADAVADTILAWAERYGLPWYRRASGRPGHLHLIVLVPPTLHTELRATVTDAAHHHGVSTTPRTTLRLLSAPHRHGLPAIVAEGTLTRADLPTSTPPRPTARKRPAVARSRSLADAPPTRGPARQSRSESEFGDALALARTGTSALDAWQHVAKPGSKARQLGQRRWRRWFWAPAVTLVDAERRLTATHAWRRFTSASPEQARYLGFDRWHAERWRPALAEAARSRPRRYRLHPPAHDRQRSVTALRRCFDNAVGAALHRTPRLPGGVRVRSLLAMLSALVPAVVDRRGAISVRAWAEAAHLDPKTIRRARDAAASLGIITRPHRYSGGTTDSDRWLPSADIAAAAQQLLDTESPTNPYTPAHGHANPHRLHRTHQHERRRWHHHLGRRTQSQSPATTHLSGNERPPRHRNRHNHSSFTSPKSRTVTTASTSATTHWITLLRDNTKMPNSLTTHDAVGIIEPRKSHDGKPP